MIGALLISAAANAPVVVPPEDVITKALPPIAWECQLQDGETKISGTFGAVEASPDHPVSNPVPALTVVSDPLELMSGKIRRQSWNRGVYFVEFWTGSQLRSFQFKFGDYAGPGTLHYWAGANGTGLCRVKKIAGEPGK